MSKKIVLTGGGTAGHVTPNLALIPYLKKEGYEIAYVGSISGIEKKLVSDAGIPYTGVETGKLRRYFDPKNFTDPFRVIRGFNEAHRFLKEFQPDIVFSKGGYVGVPVVQAAASLKIPVICHESDMTPGLANKLCMPFAKKICCNFPETMKDLPAQKAVLTGTPIREELFQGCRNTGLKLCGFTPDKPVLMVIGGSLTTWTNSCRSSRSCICAAGTSSTTFSSQSQATSSLSTWRMRSRISTRWRTS